MSSEETPLKAYTFHGLSFKIEGENARGDCPFCEKGDHFFVKVKTNQYNCRRCQAEGNIFGFLAQLHEASRVKSGVKNTSLQKLSEERGIPVSEFMEWGLVVSIIDGSFLLPQYNTKGKLANMARIVKVDGKWKVYGTPTCKLHPFGTNLLKKQQTTLWVTEGPWDGMALSAALRNLRRNGGRWTTFDPKLGGPHEAIRTHGVISVPGAGTFNADYLQHFDGREVVLAYDNDHPFKPTSSQKKIQPGWDGMNRVVRITTEEVQHAKSLQILVWGKGGFDANLADGYDLRDLLRDQSPGRAMTFLSEHLSKDKLAVGSVKVKSEEAQKIQPLDCRYFAELCDHWGKPRDFYFPESLKRTLAVSVATVISVPLPGEQLWFRIIGPPGSGKTTIAESLSSCPEMCFPTSILTGWHSGMNKSRATGRKEPSLVPQMDGKCVIIKDADTLVSAGNRDKILAELRDIYDGSSRARYRTGKTQVFEDHRSGFLLCGTDSLRALNRTFLGERFLDMDIVGDSETGNYLDSAMSSAFASMRTGLDKTSEAPPSHAALLKRVTYGYLLNLSQRITSGAIVIPTASTGIQEQLKAQAQLLSLARAKVERDGDEMMYRPRAELATRLIKQFVKLATCLALVYDKPTIDRDILSIVSTVLGNTACGFSYEVVKYLYAHPKGRENWHMAASLGLATTTLRRVCDDLQELGIIVRKMEDNKSGVGGRNSHLFYLSDEVRSLVRTASIL